MVSYHSLRTPGQWKQKIQRLYATNLYRKDSIQNSYWQSWETRDNFSHSVIYTQRTIAKSKILFFSVNLSLRPLRTSTIISLKDYYFWLIQCHLIYWSKSLMKSFRKLYSWRTWSPIFRCTFSNSLTKLSKYVKATYLFKKISYLNFSPWFFKSRLKMQLVKASHNQKKNQ